MISARTSAVAITGLDDAVARARAYDASGADALFLGGVTALAELEAIRAVTALPLILGGGVDALGGSSAVAPLGVRIALQGHHPFMAAVRAVHETLQALRQGVATKDLANQPEPELMKRLSRDAAYASATKNFMGG